jgi:protein involved in ribonucleotide reduction
MPMIPDISKTLYSTPQFTVAEHTSKFVKSIDKRYSLSCSALALDGSQIFQRRLCQSGSPLSLAYQLPLHRRCKFELIVKGNDVVTLSH